MTGMDLDVMDAGGAIHGGDRRATITVASNNDILALGALVTSVATVQPDFSGTTKTVVDLTPHPGGAVLAGDTLEYTIVVTNSGTDSSVGTLLTDVIPAGTTYVHQSIQVSNGGMAAPLTDSAGDDQAEYLWTIGNVRARLEPAPPGRLAGPSTRAPRRR